MSRRPRASSTCCASSARRTGASILLITHDLGVVATTCHRVAVMHAGQVVEVAPVRALFRHPAHPYTRALVRSIPRIDREIAMEPIPGAVPSLLNAPAGCRYADRCPWVEERCRQAEARHDRDRARAFRRLLRRGGRSCRPCVRSTTSRSTSRCADRRRGCARCATASRRWCAPSTASRSASRPAPRWGWWASRAAASPRSPARWCGWCGRRRDTSGSKAPS